MRFLFVAPRYHTNQVPIIEGLVEQGHEVLFLSHFRGGVEDYSCIEPIIIGYSLFSPKHIKIGFPPIIALYKTFKSINPDVAILRERSVYTIFAYQICRLLKIPAILYNQSPLWEDEIKNDLAHRLVRRLIPANRITPVLGFPGPGKVSEPGARFVPFVMPPMIAPERKKYSDDGTLRIFTIGKYEKRKNHLMLIEIIANLMNDKTYQLHLTISGDCSTDAHIHFYKKVEDYVITNQLNDKVLLLKNLNRKEVFKIYEKVDLFIIPSTDEPASISQLEAMAHSLPVICSDANGTACYIEDGINGFIFADNDKKALNEVINKICDNTKLIPEMGRASYEIIESKCNLINYLKSILEIYHKMVC